MFCTKCGISIRSGNICRNCKRIAIEEMLDASPFPEPRNRMFGFKKALASTLCAFLGYHTSYYAFMTFYFSVFFKNALATIFNHIQGWSELFGFEPIDLEDLNALEFIFGDIFSGANVTSAILGSIALLIALPLTIIAIIFAISSIKTFKTRSKACKKPIATLILGICGLVFGIGSVIYILEAIFFACVSVLFPAIF